MRGDTLRLARTSGSVGRVGIRDRSIPRYSPFNSLGGRATLATGNGSVRATARWKRMGHEMAADPGNYKPIKVKDLVFDPANPRLPASLNGADDEAVMKWMLEDASLIDLVRSIAAVGFFPGEPLLVAGSTGPFAVVEGNRRLAALRLIADPSTAPTRKRAVENAVQEAKPIDEVPCLVFQKRESILKYLGYRHITGVKEWEPLAKARYMSQLFSSFPDGSAPLETKLRDLARTIGSRSDYVGRLLTALALYEAMKAKNFFRIPSVGEETISFSLLLVALNHSGTSDFIGIGSAANLGLVGLKKRRFEELCRWIYAPQGSSGKTVLGDSRNMKFLAAAVRSPAALEALRGGSSLREALDTTGTPGQRFSDAVSRSAQHLEAAKGLRPKLQRITDADASTLSHISSMAHGLAQ